MPRLVVSLLLAIMLGAVPTRTAGDSGLTALVNAAYFPRTESPALHEMAHERAVEISRDFSHAGMRAGTAEVIAWNSGYQDPVSHAVEQWIGSPTHDAILSDPSLTLIGCAEYVAPDQTHYFACVLSGGPASPAPTPAPVGPAPGGDAETTPAGATPAPLLPNTAMRKP